MFIPWFVISVSYHIDVKTSIVVFALFLWKKILEDQITKSALQSSRVPQPSCNRIYGGLRSGLNGVPECAMFLFHYSCTYECSSICVTVLRITFSFSLSHWVSCVPCNSFEWSACAFRKDHDLQILGEHHYVGENILERPCETIHRFLHRSGFIFFWWWKAKFGLPLFHSVVWFSLPRLAADATVQPCRMPMLTTAMFIHRLGKGWCTVAYIRAWSVYIGAIFCFYIVFFSKKLSVWSVCTVTPAACGMRTNECVLPTAVGGMRLSLKAPLRISGTPSYKECYLLEHIFQKCLRWLVLELWLMPSI